MVSGIPERLKSEIGLKVAGVVQVGRAHGGQLHCPDRFCALEVRVCNFASGIFRVHSPDMIGRKNY